MNEQKYPLGWDEQRVQALITELDDRTEKKWVAADEKAFSSCSASRRRPMLKELETYTGLPEAAKQVVLALSIVIDRIGTLPKADREDLFELLLEWRKTGDPEERRGVQRAMEEVLAQIPVGAKPLALAEDRPMARGLAQWASHVGGKIKALREGAGWNQTQLAEKAGLTQSHISRLEHAEHSPTNFTLEKIAKALGVEVGEIDPCAESFS